jgi:hypothetical protein
MGHFSPVPIIRETTFGDKAVYMRVPFQGSAKSMKDTDETGSKVFGFIYLEKHTLDNRTCGVKQAV